MDLGKCDICGQRGNLIFSGGMMRCFGNNSCRGSNTADNESPVLDKGRSTKTIQRYQHYRDLGTAPGAMVPNSDGEYVKFADVVALMKDLPTYDHGEIRGQHTMQPAARARSVYFSGPWALITDVLDRLGIYRITD